MNEEIQFQLFDVQLTHQQLSRIGFTHDDVGVLHKKVAAFVDGFIQLSTLRQETKVLLTNLQDSTSVSDEKIQSAIDSIAIYIVICYKEYLVDLFHTEQKQRCNIDYETHKRNKADKRKIKEATEVYLKSIIETLSKERCTLWLDETEQARAISAEFNQIELHLENIALLALPEVPHKSQTPISLFFDKVLKHLGQAGYSFTYIPDGWFDSLNQLGITTNTLNNYNRKAQERIIKQREQEKTKAALYRQHSNTTIRPPKQLSGVMKNRIKNTPSWQHRSNLKESN